MVKCGMWLFEINRPLLLLRAWPAAADYSYRIREACAGCRKASASRGVQGRRPAEKANHCVISSRQGSDLSGSIENSRDDHALMLFLFAGARATAKSLDARMSSAEATAKRK